MSMNEYIDNVIKSANVIVFSKTFCPYCDHTKELLDSLNCQNMVIELDEMDSDGHIQNYLYELTNQKTVPNIFISGKHIGGNDKLQSLYKSGELLPLIKNFCN